MAAVKLILSLGSPLTSSSRYRFSVIWLKLVEEVKSKVSYGVMVLCGVVSSDFLLFLCSADIAVLKEQVAMLSFKDRISSGPRLALFSPAIISRNGKHSVASDCHDFMIIAVNKDSPLHVKVIRLSREHPPYKRLLCWRLRQSIATFGCLVSCLHL